MISRHSNFVIVLGVTGKNPWVGRIGYPWSPGSVWMANSLHAVTRVWPTASVWPRYVNGSYIFPLVEL